MIRALFAAAVTAVAALRRSRRGTRLTHLGSVTPPDGWLGHRIDQNAHQNGTSPQSQVNRLEGNAFSHGECLFGGSDKDPVGGQRVAKPADE